jgi:hypothetical protein
MIKILQKEMEMNRGSCVDEILVPTGYDLEIHFPPLPKKRRGERRDKRRVNV